MALRQFVGVSGNKSIILMSDGDVNVSDDNLEKAQSNDIKIHVVALGQGANSSALRKCAEKTDGEFFIVKTAVELESIYDKLSENNQLNFNHLSDTDGDGVPDDIEISGVPMPSGKLVFLDPTNTDTDNDGLSDGDEVGKLRRSYYVPTDVPDCAVTYKFSFDVTSDPTMVDSDEDGDLDNKDPNPMNYLLNDLFIHNTSLVYELAQEYADMKYAEDIHFIPISYNYRYPESLVFMFIRYFEIDNYGNHKYCIGLWPSVAGELNEEFVDFVKQRNVKLYDYFSEVDTIASKPSKYDIDLNHMAATISALLFESGWAEGFKYGMMPEKHIDALAGWAGDMQSLIDDCFLCTQENQAKTIDAYFDEYLGDNNQRCGIDDLNADADAVNISHEILSRDFTSLNNVLTQYYTSGISMRYTAFIKTALNDSEETIEPYTKTHYVFFRWPILHDNVKISSDESKKIKTSFWDYLNKLKALEER